jgi:hypothetical protein
VPERVIYMPTAQGRYSKLLMVGTDKSDILAVNQVILKRLYDHYHESSWMLRSLPAPDFYEAGIWLEKEPDIDIIDIFDASLLPAQDTQLRRWDDPVELPTGSYNQLLAVCENFAPKLRGLGCVPWVHLNTGTSFVSQVFKRHGVHVYQGSIELAILERWKAQPKIRHIG